MIMPPDLSAPFRSFGLLPSYSALAPTWSIFCFSAKMKKQLPIHAVDRHWNNRSTKLGKIEREQRDRMLDRYIITCSALLTAAMVVMLLAG